MRCIRLYISKGILNIDLANRNENTSIATCDMLDREVAGMTGAKQGHHQISLKGEPEYYIINIADNKISYTAKVRIGLTN